MTNDRQMFPRLQRTLARPDFCPFVLIVIRYSAAKRYISSNPSLGFQDGIATHFLASLVAGTVATTACAPADVLKSRVQNAVSVDGVKPVRKGVLIQHSDGS